MLSDPQRQSGAASVAMIQVQYVWSVAKMQTAVATHILHLHVCLAHSLSGTRAAGAATDAHCISLCVRRSANEARAVRDRTCRYRTWHGDACCRLQVAVPPRAARVTLPLASCLVPTRPAGPAKRRLRRIRSYCIAIRGSRAASTRDSTSDSCSSHLDISHITVVFIYS